jgi:hypothetical protein
MGMNISSANKQTNTNLRPVERVGRLKVFDIWGLGRVGKGKTIRPVNHDRIVAKLLAKTQS